jgi:plastocyanin
VIKDFHFTPQTLTVKAGEKITWINRDEEPHTVVSVEKQFKNPPRSTPTRYLPSPRAPRHFVHPKMTGTIVVEQP